LALLFSVKDEAVLSMYVVGVSSQQSGYFAKSIKNGGGGK